MTICCGWCGRAFELRATGRSSQWFCQPAYRHAFWSAARCWVWRAVEGGDCSRRKC